MKEVWLFQTGEPIFTDSNYTRPMRCMNLFDVLISRGYKVRVFTTNFYHQEKRHRFTEYSHLERQGYDIHYVDSPGYRTNISAQRFFDHFILGRNLSKLLSSFDYGPAFAVIGFPPIEFAFVAARFCSENNVPFTVDIKDKWPDFFYSKVPKLAHPLLNVLLFHYQNQTRYIFRSADFITTVSDRYLKWAAKKAERDVKESDRVLYLTDIGSDETNNTSVDLSEFIDNYSDTNIYVCFSERWRRLSILAF